MSDVIREDFVQATVAGEMFVYSSMITALGAGAVHYTAFRTGSYPVMIERRSYGTTADNIAIRLYEGVTATGGTLNPGTNRSRTPESLAMPEPQTCRVGVTPGALPTQPLFTLVLLSTNKVNASLGDASTDKIQLAANADYVLGVTNNDAQARDFTWSFAVRRLPR